MATYVDYAYYSGTYHGSFITAGEFAGLAIQASAEIDLLTFDRTAPIMADGTDLATVAKIKNATCAVAEELKQQAGIGIGGLVKSESIGQHSVTYVDDPTNRNQARTRTAAKRFIGVTGLMFPGLDEVK